MSGEQYYKMRQSDIEAIFESWMKSYEIDPELFLEHNESDNYGETCAKYFLSTYEALKSD
jgi:hypothetical protein